MSENNTREIADTSLPDAELVVRNNVPPRMPLTENREPEYASEVDLRDEIHLRHYLARVMRHKFLVLGVTALLTVAAAAYLFSRETVYEAETRVQVDYENKGNLADGSNEPTPFVDRAYFNTQLELLSSPSLIRRVVRKLELDKNNVFLPSSSGIGVIPTAIGKPVPTDASASEIADGDVERLAPYVEAIRDSLSVQPVLKPRQTVKDTRLIEIRYSHPNPEITAKITNAIADELVDTNLDKKLATNTTENRYLRNNIRELQAQIRSDEEKLLGYGRNYQLPTLEGAQNTVVERLVGLNRQLLEAENERKVAEAAYKAALEPGAAEALAEEGTKSIADIDAKLDELRQRRSLLLVEATEKFPEVREVDEQIAELEQQAKQRRQRATGIYKTNLETRHRQALAREQAIRTAFEQQRDNTLDQNEAAINYRIIQQSIETNKKLLDSMTQRSNENEMLRAKVPNNISVVDYAATPTEPVDQKRMQYLALASLFAFSAGIGLALLRDYFDDSVYTADEMEKALSVPSLAIIPRAKNGLLANTRRRLIATDSLHLSGDENTATVVSGGAELIIGSHPDSPMNEAFRRLRTALLLSPTVGNLRRILVTSSRKGEGKTTTTINIATSLAQSGASVLIIDADLRDPSIHKIFNLNPDYGLTDILAVKESEIDISKHIAKHASNLHILPAGQPIPDAAEWLGSDVFEETLDALALHYDHIIIDSPPLSAFADSMILASLVDGVLMVVEGNRSSQEIVRQSVKMLRTVGARVVGVVMNKVSTPTENYYRYKS